jgi:tRNA (guanine10-N2)-methyltransferase
MPQYILRLSLEHPTFRLPSLKSIADLYGFPLRFVSEDRFRSILVVELEKDEDAEKFLERGILVMYVAIQRSKLETELIDRSVCRLIAQGSSYDEMHQQVQADLSVFEPYMEKKFKFEFESVNHRSTSRRQR